MLVLPINIILRPLLVVQFTGGQHFHRVQSFFTRLGVHLPISIETYNTCNLSGGGPDPLPPAIPTWIRAWSSVFVKVPF